MEFKSGRPSELTDEVKQRVLAAIPEVISVNQVAYRSRVPPTSLKNWLKRGETDANTGIDSHYAQFWTDFRDEQSKVVRQSLDYLRTCPKNYGSLTWILEKCFREDFGKESEEFREILEKFAIIFPLLGKGDALNGGKETKEVHPESD